jgi:hypothetical protein
MIMAVYSLFECLKSIQIVIFENCLGITKDVLDIKTEPKIA